jgi:ferric-dicitrate binding protein FerR (iron transport regulator)
VVKDVKLGSPQAAPRRVAAGESFRDGDSINTGATGRSELTFADQTIARLGAKTNVSFSNGTRTLDLGEGAMLFQIPKSAGDVKIETAAIAVASTGATAIIERHGQFYVKVLVLEGTVRCYLTHRLGESLLLQPGQILITKPDVTALPEPADFDIAREMKTCLLVREFQPLRTQRRIESEEQKQLNLIAKGTYIPSNLVIFGRGTEVTLVNAPSTTPPSKPLTNTGHQSRTP